MQDSAAVSQSFSEIKKQELYSRLSHIRQQWMRRLNIMGETWSRKGLFGLLLRGFSSKQNQDSICTASEMHRLLNCKA